jgi:hypothetical protein
MHKSKNQQWIRQAPSTKERSHFSYTKGSEKPRGPSVYESCPCHVRAIAHGAILPHVCSRIARRNADMYAGAASPFDGPVVPLKPAAKVWPIEGGDGEAVATNDERGTDLKAARA